MAGCILCGATATDRAGALKHEGACPHFMRGPDPGGDPHEWSTLLDDMSPRGNLRDLRLSLSRSEELTGEAFKACVLARNLAEHGVLELGPEVVELLERERHYGRAIDAHEAARALRMELRP